MKRLFIGLTIITAVSLFAQPVFAFTTPDRGGMVKGSTASLNNTKGSSSLSADLSLPLSQSTDTSKVAPSFNAQSLSTDSSTYVTGEILVKYKNNKVNLNTVLGRVAASNFINSKSLGKIEDLRGNNISLLRIKDAKTVEQKIAELKNDPNVEYAEPNYRRYPAVINTNDTYKDRLWGLDNTGQLVNGVSGTNDADIDAPEAWAISEATTSASVTVAIIDSGVAYYHPDLVANMWDGTNCKDENGNALGGCNHGYDYEDGDKTPLPIASSHGTHIAGTIAAAKGNGLGIIGVAPQAKIMAIKYGFDIASEIKAIDFAIQNGAKVINASFTGTASSTFEYDAINRFKTAGGVFVAAAGNNSTNNDASTHYYPSDYNLDNIISVAATDQNDALATFSDYGATSVDVGAPGTNIYSAVVDEIQSSENFNGVTAPNLPTGWTKTANWGTRVYSDGDNVLDSDYSHTPYVNNADSDTFGLRRSLTVGMTISFYTQCDTEYYTPESSDYMALEVDEGSGPIELFKWNETTLDSLNGDSDPSGSASYYFQDYKIPATGGSDFSYGFKWHTDSSNVPVQDYQGCFVDDITITRYISSGTYEKYSFKDGTSMATPHVAGLAALIEGYNPSLTSSQVKNAILTTGDPLASLSGKTVSGKRINAQRALQAVNPAKAITAFNFVTPAATGVVNETTHTIAVTVPFGTTVTALVPTIATSTGASVSPASGIAQDFTNPVTYTVTAADSSTQAYIVTVTFAADSDIASVAADKAALVDNDIKGANADLANITGALAVLPAVGSVNVSAITWASSDTSVISNDGQTVIRPVFASGNTTITLTATLTKGAVTDTKVFTLTVIKYPASAIVSQTPVNGALSVATTSVITVVFDRAISVISSNISISPNVAFSFSVSGDTLIITPSSPLSNNTIYTLTLVSIQDGNGNVLSSYTSQFTTKNSYSVSIYDNNENGGLNLISLPVQPVNTAIVSVLGTAASSIDSVWTYDPSDPAADSSGWLVYYPAHPELSNLSTMSTGYGYWVTAHANTTLSGSGSLFTSTTPPSRALQSGWNLLGYYQLPGENSSTPSNAFSSASDYTSLVGFDNQSGVFKAVSSIVAGDGFWMALPSAGSFYPAYSPTVTDNTATFSPPGVSGTLTVTVAGDNPTASQIAVASSTTTGVNLLSFNMKANNQDITITDLAASLGTSGNNLSDVISTVKLMKGSTVISSKTVSTGTYGVVTFSNINQSIVKDATANYWISVDLKGDALYADGTTLVASTTVAGWDVSDADGATVTPSAAAAGNTQTLTATGISVALGTVTAIKSTCTLTSCGDVGTYTISFTVTAGDNDVYISGVAGSAGISYATTTSSTAGVTDQGVANLSAASTVTGDNAGAYYKVFAGTSRTFTLTVSYTATATGYTGVSLSGITYGTTSSLGSTYTSNLDTFKTIDVNLVMH